VALKPTVKLALALAAAALLVVPASALGVHRPGSYKGKTSQRGGKVSFRAGKASVRSFRVTASWRCSDGERFTNTATINPSMRISRRGRFGGRHKNRRYPDAGAARVRGRVVGRRARGSFTATLRFSGDKPDPKGTARCSTGRIRWSARRR
jgi:hypothetical protein